MGIVSAAISCSTAVIFWIYLRRRHDARTVPLFVGIAAYIFIALLRAGVRGVIFTDELKSHKWLFYVVSAALSGVFEEVGRYVVFRYVIPNYDRWSDCAAYALAHCSTEVLITSHIFSGSIFDGVITAFSCVLSIPFSLGLSVLVFISVHRTSDRRHLWLAIALHTAADIVPAFYFRRVIPLGAYFLADLLFTAVIALIGRSMYRKYREIDNV